MKIDVLDATDQNLYQHRVGLVRKAPCQSTVITLGSMCNGVSQMVSLIRAAVSDGHLDVLRIWGHGRAGHQRVSGDATGDPDYFELSGIALSNIDLVRGDLITLRRKFNRNSRVELKGCDVADTTEGETFISDLADIFNVPVYAGTVLQYGVWDPPVVMAIPGGALACTEGYGLCP